MSVFAENTQFSSEYSFKKKIGAFIDDCSVSEKMILDIYLLKTAKGWRALKETLIICNNM